MTAKFTWKISSRILYEASSNSEWGEHELDYILMLRAREPVTLAPNPEEVQDTEWVAREHLQDFLGDLESRGVGITPWFKLCTKVRKYSITSDHGVTISSHYIYITSIHYRSYYLTGGRIWKDWKRSLTIKSITSITSDNSDSELQTKPS